VQRKAGILIELNHCVDFLGKKLNKLKNNQAKTSHM